MTITQYNSSVRQMSQSKFDSMKNASGKIPDLANQIVMTNSEDTNTSCLRTEVVYDMTSSDSSKNWGYTTGLLGGNTYNNSNINLDKYESFKFVLDIYPNTLSDIGSSNIVVEMEHITLIDGKSKILGNVPYIQNGAWSDTYFRYEIQIGQNNIYCQFYWTGAGAQSNNTKYRITKIYGILKTPSMIYTGDELTAGNGISIENGVISGIKSEIVWSGNFAYLASEQTMSLDLSKYKYVEFMTSVGNILHMNLQDTRPNGDLYVYLNASSYYNGSWHDGVKCEGTYYYGTKQIKWSGNYCGLAQVRGYWW